jgi:putative sterol carrier protein
MCPIVISTTYGEKDAHLMLTNAWELLGGKLCDGICAYVEDPIDFEGNETYSELIEKKAENLYRTISKKKIDFPSSSFSIRQNYIKNGLELTPQEGEQLSKYVSDDIYVKKQKEDIEELASFFKDILNKQSSSEDEFISAFKNHYNAQPGFSCNYMFYLEDKETELAVKINGVNIEVSYEKMSSPDITLRLKTGVLENVIHGHSTFQKAFMTGEMSSKGNFNTMRMLDQLFNFN